MAHGKQKYAGLPDLDDAAPEIYETPDLIDDASTAQTATQRTTSPTPSDEPDLGRHDPDTGLDRQRIDRNEARRRFEPSLVDARDVDFSDSLANGRKSYKTNTRHRRRRRGDGAEELGDLSDSEDESLGRKLARLRREAEELKMELQRREQEKEAGILEEDGEGLEDGVEALNHMLNGLNTPSQGGETSSEAALARKLDSEFTTQSSQPIPQQSAASEPTPPSSTLTSLATLSDRLTALESSLGLSTTAFTSSTPILPILASLTSQMTTLSTTLSPPSTTSTTGAITTSNSTSTINLDTLTTRVRDLTSQTDRLTLSRKAATQAATELRQARLKAATSAVGPLPTPHPSASSQYLHPHHRPSNNNNAATQETLNLADLHATESLNAKITALYSTLPRIGELSPLLPVVLERLRSLQSIHTAAASAKGDLEALEKGQAEMGSGIEEWKGALEGMEASVREAEGLMGKNGEVLGGMVRGVEERLRGLEEELRRSGRT